MKGKICGYYYNLRPSITLGLSLINALWGKGRPVVLRDLKSLFNEHLVPLHVCGWEKYSRAKHFLSLSLNLLKTLNLFIISVYTSAFCHPISSKSENIILGKHTDILVLTTVASTVETVVLMCSYSRFITEMQHSYCGRWTVVANLTCSLYGF